MVAGIFAKMATQKDLDGNIKIKNSSIVDVEWLDACAHTNVEAINPKKLLEWLCPTHTFGKVVAQDNTNKMDQIYENHRLWLKCNYNKN